MNAKTVVSAADAAPRAQPVRALLRAAGQHMVAPRADVIFESGDGVILVLAPEAGSNVSRFARPW